MSSVSNRAHCNREQTHPEYLNERYIQLQTLRRRLCWIIRDDVLLFGPDRAYTQHDFTAVCAHVCLCVGLCWYVILGEGIESARIIIVIDTRSGWEVYSYIEFEKNWRFYWKFLLYDVIAWTPRQSMLLWNETKLSLFSPSIQFTVSCDPWDLLVSLMSSARSLKRKEKPRVSTYLLAYGPRVKNFCYYCTKCLRGHTCIVCFF